MTDATRPAGDPSEEETTSPASLPSADAEATSPPGAEVSASAGPAEDAVVARGRRRRQFLLVAVVAFVLGAGGVGYWAFRELAALEARFEVRSGEKVSAVKAAMEVELSAQRRDLAGTVTGLGAVSSHVESLDQALGTFRSEVDALSVRLAEAVESDPTELLFAELDYLLRVANHRIALEHDREGAIIALKRAEWRLAGLDSPMLDPVRAQLAADRVALERAPAVALDDIFRALGMLIESIDDLQSGAERIAPQGASPAVEERRQVGWRAFVSAIRDDLRQFVVVKRADGAVAPQLIPDQDYLVRENLRLSLENARSAALRRDTGHFRRSLLEAERWLSGYFPPGESAVVAMSSEIRRLVELELSPPLPDISGSVELVARLSGAGILRGTGAPGSVAPEAATEAKAPAASGGDGLPEVETGQ